MGFPFERVAYEQLNARQQENYNFQKLSGVLAEFGFTTIRLSDDWNGADLLAQHLSGETLRIQLKGRLTFCEKYRGKNLWICFREDQDWYLFPHDKVLEQAFGVTTIAETTSWTESGGYSFPSLPRKLRPLLEPYRLTVRREMCDT